jgi:DNA-binding response OmpR family regulator
LVIEDEGTLRRALVRHLRDAGFEVRGCTDFESAEADLEQNPADAVVFECYVRPYAPEVFVSAMRARHPQTVLVACCSSLMPQRRLALVDSGADAVLLKTRAYADLVPLVEAHLARRGGCARGAETDRY